MLLMNELRSFEAVKLPCFICIRRDISMPFSEDFNQNVPRFEDERKRMTFYQINSYRLSLSESKNEAINYNNSQKLHNSDTL
jgi:hypothetical protein